VAKLCLRQRKNNSVEKKNQEKTAAAAILNKGYIIAN
jgi:hypothetical protein